MNTSAVSYPGVVSGVIGLVAIQAVFHVTATAMVAVGVGS
jgi:hypothetical protein